MTDQLARIMVVDDSETFLAEIQSHLQQHYKEPVQALFNVPEALQYLGKHLVEVVISDLFMEPVSGLHLLKLAREQEDPPEVIMITSHSSLPTAIKALQLGATDYLTKPISDWTVVTHAVDKARERVRLRRQNTELLAELAVRNAELSHSVSLLRVLTDVTVRMHRSRDINEILNILVRTVSTTLSARRVSLMVLDKASNLLQIKVAVGIDRELIDTVRVDPHEGVVGKVIASRQPLIVEDAVEDDRLPSPHTRKGSYHGRVFLCAPIFIGEKTGQGPQVMGVVNISERTQDRPFRPGETEFVLYLARQAALALESAGVVYVLRQNIGGRDEATEILDP